MICDVPEIRQRLRGELPPSAPGLPEVLQAFLMVATEFDGLPTSLLPFTPPDEFAAIFEALARCGYVESVSGEVGWTDRVGPLMRAFYAWDREGPSSAG